MKTIIKILTCLALTINLFSCYEEYFHDYDKPEIVSITPSSNQQNVPSDSVVKVTFNKKMDAIYTNECFTLSSGSGEIDGYYSWNSSGKVLTFTPKKELTEIGAYTILIDSGAEDTEGNDIGEDYKSIFYVYYDLTPPEIVSCTFTYLPGHAAPELTGIDPGTPITVTFSEPMDIDSIFDAFSISPAVNGSFTWANGNTELTFTPLYDLSYGTTYTVSLNEALKDSNGNTLRDAYILNFTVGDDFTKPVITSVETLDAVGGTIILAENSGAPNTGIEKDHNITITFDKEMSLTEMYNAITISPSVDFTLLVTPAGTDPTVATVVFTEPMDSEEYYTLKIATTVTDLQNNALDHEYIYHIYTDGAESRAPKVNAIEQDGVVWSILNQVVEPAALDGSGDSASNFKITFSQKVQPTTLDISVEYVMGTGGSATPRIANINWDLTVQELTFDILDVALANTYKITVKGGADGLKDQYGNYLKEDFVQYFRF